MARGSLTLKDIYCVLVVYNKSLKDSVTFNCLKNVKDINIIVCDNSTKDFGNESYLKGHGFTYINMHGNKGLSKAYNAALNHLNDLLEAPFQQPATPRGGSINTMEPNQPSLMAGAKGTQNLSAFGLAASGGLQSYEGDALNKSGLLCLFDDDTFLPNDYFDELLKENLSADIFLPIVCDEVGILSPCKFSGLRVERIKELSELNDKNITGINSGMAISLEVFKDYRYNENYFLDYIDHDFLRTMKLKNKKIKVLNTKLNQRFSRSEEINFESSLKRFKIFKCDFKYFYRENFKSKIFANISLLKRVSYLTLKFKSLKFLIKR